MFTLKLYRVPNGQLVTRVQAVHHVQTMEIGKSGRIIEVWAFHGPEPSTYDAYFIGEKEDGMDALNDDNHFHWALLENSDGNTTEHFRPAGYGRPR